MKTKSEIRNQKSEEGTEDAAAIENGEDKVGQGNGDGSGLLEALGIEDAEPWTEVVEGAALLDELKETLERFVVLPKWGGEALALWVVHTYAFQLGDVSTYVAAESPQKRCGKTTLLSVLSELVNRPVVAANMSPPAFFRVIEETQPTLLIDEADTFLAGNDELRGILNAGYGRKTAYVVRVAGKRYAKTPNSKNQTPEKFQETNFKSGNSDGSRLARFSCWCPKVIAAIGRLPETLADRCIVIRMQRKTADQRCDRLRFLSAGTLRRKCARFVRDNTDAIAKAQPELPGGLNDRAADIWEPLIVLADLAGGDWPQRARQAAAALSGNAQENNPIASLLKVIAGTFAQAESVEMFSRTLVEALNASDDRLWLELNEGKLATELWLARQLRGFGIRPRIKKINGKRARGYALSDFQAAFQEAKNKG